MDKDQPAVVFHNHPPGNTPSAILPCQMVAIGW
jgi:hypothetical protein